MKILVIDDARRNALSAASLLPGNVTVADTIKKAYEILGSGEHFDAVLTDLKMPLGNFRGAMNTRDYDYPSSDLDAGLVFALKAVKMGIRTVICTDADHHNDWICSLLDLLQGGKCEVVAYMEARSAHLDAYYDEERDEIVFCEWNDPRKNGKPIVKDWKAAMIRSGLFPELGSDAVEE